VACSLAGWPTLQFRFWVWFPKNELSLGLNVFISQAFAQAAPAASATPDMFGSLTSMLPLILMFVVLYFVMIRPQMKRQKEHKSMIDALAKGDEVIIAGGLLGRVSKMGETYLGVEVANGVEIQVQRSSVVLVLPKGTFK
jgi:preprotein translocase subunit YajC